MSARPETFQAHTQLCRLCGATKAASAFARGSAHCLSCAPQCVSGMSRRDAITKHAIALDLALYALWSDGGFGAVHIGVAEAVKRLALRKRVEITAEGWVV